ncbi:MAG: hypothetical protein ACLVG9_09425, partial [Eubacteriales bacterium]
MKLNQILDFCKANIVVEKKTCKKCGKEHSVTKLLKSDFICPECGYYFRMNALQRIALIADDDFQEIDGVLKSKNLIDFPGYDEKLKKALETNDKKEEVTCGTCTIGGNKAAIFVMDST